MNDEVQGSFQFSVFREDELPVWELRVERPGTEN
jgi:hypothetical protein